MCSSQGIPSASEDNAGDQETELAAALRRESHLKERMHELVNTLDKVSRNSEQRHLQSAELVNDLKRANRLVSTENFIPVKCLSIVELSQK